MKAIPSLGWVPDGALMRSQQLASIDDIDGKILADAKLVHQHMPSELETKRHESNQVQTCIVSLNNSPWSWGP